LTPRAGEAAPHSPGWRGCSSLPALELCIAPRVSRAAESPLSAEPSPVACARSQAELLRAEGVSVRTGSAVDLKSAAPRPGEILTLPMENIQESDSALQSTEICQKGTNLNLSKGPDRRQRSRDKLKLFICSECEYCCEMQEKTWENNRKVRSWQNLHIEVLSANGLHILVPIFHRERCT
ncbi:hypothetical protein scyTo_0020895, partial [Scyliorhinus torazame]|nr:hypothetical protein [Scyliorhinus torazame]